MTKVIFLIIMYTSSATSAQMTSLIKFKTMEGCVAAQKSIVMEDLSDNIKYVASDCTWIDIRETKVVQ